MKDNYGFTAEEWGKHQFEFEYCSECGGDWNDHDYILFQGNYFGSYGCWFAKCRDENTERIEELNQEYLDTHKETTQ